MKNKKRLKHILAGLAAVVFASIIFLIVRTDSESKDTITVGFIMTGKADEAGWNQLHYQGIFSAGQDLDVQLIVKEEVKEYTGQCEQAIHELAEEKAEIIILSSYGYAKEVLDVVKAYPEITFYSESFDYTASNLKGYFARMYQARYLAGIVAGMQTKNNNIGYVAAMANNEVNRGINAFTLGVKRVNPKAEVTVAWSNSWDDVEQEKKLAAQLIKKEEIDVITYHQNQPNVVEVAEEYGIFSIGYHAAESCFSDNYLTASSFHWDDTYKEILLDYIRGNSKNIDTYWIGIESGAVGLSDFSSKVSPETIKEVEKAEEEIINGFDVFSGEIRDTQGKFRCNEGETISDDNLLKNLNWYVEGIKFYEG